MVAGERPDGRLLGGRYALQRPLGGGGGGRVHEALDMVLGRRVAVKLLAPVDGAPGSPGAGAGPSIDPVVRERFRREALTLARVSSGAVVRVLDVGGTEADIPYLVMELLDGVDLAALAEDGPLGVDVVCEIAAGICEGLAAVHAAGIVHRDVKPSNVMVTRSGQVVLFDFGLARAVDHRAVTAVSAAVGTPRYMSPEAVQGRQPQPFTDLYGLGACLHTLLAGRPPFEAEEDIGAVVLRIVGDGIPSLGLRAADHPAPDAFAALSALVDELVAIDPADRPRTAEEVRARLPYQPDAASRRLLVDKVAARVQAQALATMTGAGRAAPPDASLPEYLDGPGAPVTGVWDAPALPLLNGDGQHVVRLSAAASSAAGPRPLVLSDATRQLVMSSMTAGNAASRLREAVTLVQRGELQEAFRMLTAVARVCAAELGRDHATTLAAEYWQAVCLARLDAGPEALAVFASVSERCDAQEGEGR